MGHLLEQQVHTLVDISTASDNKTLLQLLKYIAMACWIFVTSGYAYIEKSCFISFSVWSCASYGKD